MTHKTFIIAGPTASGKSDFAHNLAKQIGGVIINCDSVQLYSGIENISASPFAERQTDKWGEIDGVPYKLFSVLPLTEQVSVSSYIEMARKEFNAARELGRPVIFVGGTGFYINALLNGISPVPVVSTSARNRAREMVEKCPDSAKELLGGDCNASDPQRIARALEVFLETGKPLSYWQKLPRENAVCPNAIKILINPPRDILNARIERRIPQMMTGGAMEEARNVIRSGWNESRAIGAAQLCMYIRQEISKSDCFTNWIVKTRQYAKRQRTWFAGQYIFDIEIKNVPTDADLKNVLDVCNKNG